LSVGVPPGFAIGRLELRDLQPPQECGGSNSDRARPPLYSAELAARQSPLPSSGRILRRDSSSAIACDHLELELGLHRRSIASSCTGFCLLSPPTTAIHVIAETPPIKEKTL
jgi:hypothetical protein